MHPMHSLVPYRYYVVVGIAGALIDTGKDERSCTSGGGDE